MSKQIFSISESEDLGASQAAGGMTQHFGGNGLQPPLFRSNLEIQRSEELRKSGPQALFGPQSESQRFEELRKTGIQYMYGSGKPEFTEFGFGNPDHPISCRQMIRQIWAAWDEGTYLSYTLNIFLSFRDSFAGKLFLTLTQVF